MTLVSDKVQQALAREGITEQSITRLGEGAWHEAYFLEKDKLVLRIPKKKAYDKKVVFNRDELEAEYAGTKAFYQQANHAVEGICPDYFTYYVSEDLTYTLETYVGRTIPLEHQSVEEAKQYGLELGECFVQLEKLDAPYPGMGYLVMEDGALKGPYDMDAKEFLIQETEEYKEELETILTSSYPFDKEAVKTKAEELLSDRSIDQEKIVFTNQDTSPENILFTENGAKMIDPFPLLATGTSLAANHVFNYTLLFPQFHNTERYKKGNYDLHKDKLRANADGFVEGYTDGSEKKKDALRIEVFIKLLTMAFEHHQLLGLDAMSREEVIRYGTKHQVEERLRFYLEELERF
ncbi:hypothetical protein [Halobacillus salinus]|uniref:Aminoglycoside phosphotransferase family protein n=1 Tax=Halobacillus salinus TaxID=192814 RepID=A0A4Z0GVU7_9BACI|nr:hypothetical protein [Halobacillus salinus]TGB01055.1 hypothetical protein E4663_18055 [Halobacillus salinus]